MLNVRDLLAAARSAQSLPSNYALAKLLDVRERDLSRWNNGHNVPSAAMVVRLAELAHLDPAAVLPAIEAQRAGDDALRAAWARAADLATKGAAVAICAVLSLWIGTGGGPDGGALLALGALALPGDSQVAFLYIVHSSPSIHCAQVLAAGLLAWWAQRAVLSLCAKPQPGNVNECHAAPRAQSR